MRHRGGYSSAPAQITMPDCSGSNPFFFGTAALRGSEARIFMTQFVGFTGVGGMQKAPTSSETWGGYFRRPGSRPLGENRMVSVLNCVISYI